jgi:predicted ester cyclase
MSDVSELQRLQQIVADLNQGSFDSVRGYMSADYFNNPTPAYEPPAHDVYHDVLVDLRAAMPDLRFELEKLESDRELITGVLTMSGTTQGPLWGGPATNKSVSWTTRVSIRPTKGRFALNFDTSVPELIGALRQINLVPPPDQMDKPSKYPIQVPEPILEALFNGGMAEKECSHLASIQVHETDVDVCPQCAVQGDVWPALRMCLICGFVGCCDTSKNKHMKQHYQETGHSIFRSIRLEESWGWCYADNAFLTSRRLEMHYSK